MRAKTRLNKSERKAYGTRILRYALASAGVRVEGHREISEFHRLSSRFCSDVSYARMRPALVAAQIWLGRPWIFIRHARIYSGIHGIHVLHHANLAPQRVPNVVARHVAFSVEGCEREYCGGTETSPPSWSASPSAGQHAAGERDHVGSRRTPRSTRPAFASVIGPTAMGAVRPVASLTACANGTWCGRGPERNLLQGRNTAREEASTPVDAALLSSLAYSMACAASPPPSTQSVQETLIKPFRPEMQRARRRLSSG